MRQLALLAAGVVVLLSGLFGPSTRAAGGSGTWQVIPPPLAVPDLKSPLSISIGRKGELYVLDVPGNAATKRHVPAHIKKLSRDGRILADHPLVPLTNQLSAAGSLTSQFSAAVDSQGHVYVAGWTFGPSSTGWTYRPMSIKKYSSQGKLLTRWRTRGKVTGNAGGIEDVPAFRTLAVDRQGAVYVVQDVIDDAQVTHCRCRLEVRVYSSTGTLMRHWPLPDPEYVPPDPACDPHLGFCPYVAYAVAALVVDPRGNLYISASVEGASAPSVQDGFAFSFVEEWSAAGTLLNRWDTDDTVLAVDTNANVYEPRLKERSPGGKVLARWSGERCGTSYWGVQMAVDDRGFIYVADPGGGNIEKVSPDGRLLTHWGGCTRLFSGVTRIAISRNGTIYGVSNFPSHVVSLSSDGRRYHTWGAPGTEPGQFSASGVAVDAEGNVYVADAGNNRIQKFSAEGRLLAVWGGPGTQPGQFKDPADIALDRRGAIYVLDAGNSRVQKLSPTGTVLLVVPLPAQKVAEYRGLSVDRESNIYVADAWAPDGRAGQILKVSRGGEAVTEWPVPPGISNSFGPEDVAVDPKGNLYVAMEDDRVLKLSPTGETIDEWLRPGTKRGEFNRPTGVAIDSKGNVYVADTGNNRVQKLTVGG
jgi:sugar lactone lactonase YvrE